MAFTRGNIKTMSQLGYCNVIFAGTVSSAHLGGSLNELATAAESVLGPQSVFLTSRTSSSFSSFASLHVQYGDIKTTVMRRTEQVSGCFAHSFFRKPMETKSVIEERSSSVGGNKLNPRSQ